MNILERVAKSVLKQAVVEHVSQVAAHTYHVKISGPALRNLDFVPGQTLKIFIGLNDGLSVTEGERKYSVWNYDTINGVIDLALCTFSQGAAAQWIARRKKGDTVHFTGPSGRFVVDYDAAQYFFAGDITALAHFYQINRALKNNRVLSDIHANTKEDWFADLDGNYPLELNTVNGNAAEAVICKIESTGFHLQAHNSMFYAAGSPDFCKELNEVFRRKYNWPLSRVKTKPFWK